MSRLRPIISSFILFTLACCLHGSAELRYNDNGQLTKIYATTLSHVDFSRYVEHVTINLVECCLKVGLKVRIGSGLVSGLLVVMHTYLYLSRTLQLRINGECSRVAMLFEMSQAANSSVVTFREGGG